MRREIWHLTEGLIFVHFAVFMLLYSSPDAADGIILYPSLLRAQPWTLITYQFVHFGMFWFFISMLVLWIMARPLELMWGSLRFLAFWLISVLGAATAAVLLGRPLAGDVFLSASLLFTYATIFPETQFYIFFILPVKVKWLALFSGGVLVLSSFLGHGVVGGIANVVGVSAGYVFFLVTRRLPTRRKLVFELQKRRLAAEVTSENAAVEQQNRGWDEAVRTAEERARQTGVVGEEDHALLHELDAARDPSITVCAPGDFGYVDDEVCRSCTGYPECAARRIRLAAESTSRADENGG